MTLVTGGGSVVGGGVGGATGLLPQAARPASKSAAQASGREWNLGFVMCVLSFSPKRRCIRLHLKSRERASGEFAAPSSRKWLRCGARPWSRLAATDVALPSDRPLTARPPAHWLSGRAGRGALDLDALPAKGVA